MASGVRIRWKLVIPFISTVGLLSIMTLMKLTPRQKTTLPQSLRNLHAKLGDGQVKRRRRPDLYYHTHLDHEGMVRTNIAGTKSKLSRNADRLHVAIVACGDRAPGAIISLKSFTMFSQALLHFHIFTEKSLHSLFLAAISKWPSVASGQLVFDLKTVQFPDVKNPTEWKMLFKLCACQRLFLPIILKDVDSLVYVDTDVLTLTPLEKIWSNFKHFNSSQLTALVAESEVPELGWYSRYSRHPFYGKQGLNSGVMLMNLTRMRKMNMSYELIPLLEKYRPDILWGDQDILNIYFHFHPEMMYTLPCNWNFRADHCMYGMNCAAAEQQGIYLIHGSRSIFYNDKQPEFKIIYNTFENYNPETGSLADVRTTVEQGFEKYKETYCGSLKAIFVNSMTGS